MVFELEEQKAGMYERCSFVTGALIVLLFTSGCQDDKHQEKLAFYYYPNKNVYYYPAENYFLYSLDSAKSWRKFNNTTSQEPALLGEKKLIYSSDLQIYKDNDSHRRKYNGTLYVINTKDSSSLSKGVEVIEQKKVILKRKITQEKKPEEKKSKTGIGKFLNKIFGKKK